MNYGSTSLQNATLGVRLEKELPIEPTRSRRDRCSESKRFWKESDALKLPMALLKLVMMVQSTMLTLLAGLNTLDRCFGIHPLTSALCQRKSGAFSAPTASRRPKYTVHLVRLLAELS